jgi:uncharacterized protein (DUF362 family)
MNPVISIWQDETPYQTAVKALDLIADDLARALWKWRDDHPDGIVPVLIKPNLLSQDVNFPCNTDVEICVAVAQFFRNLVGCPVIVGEGTTYERTHNLSTLEAMKNHGYTEHEGLWTLLDFHADEPGTWFETVNYETPAPVELAVAQSVVDAFVVDVAKFKTHDVLGLTLSLKNMMGTLMAARYKDTDEIITRGDVKGYMHGFENKKPNLLTEEQNVGPSKVALAANLVRLARCRPPNVAIIDGSTVMEGSGPRRGKVCEDVKGVVIAGTDFVAVDAICAAIADIDLDSFNYVKRAGEIGLGQHDVSQVHVEGIPWTDLEHPIERHPLSEKSSPWTDEELENFLRFTTF